MLYKIIENDYKRNSHEKSTQLLFLNEMTTKQNKCWRYEGAFSTVYGHKVVSHDNIMTCGMTNLG